VWQEGHKLVLTVYSVTKKFPKDEIFGLTNQIRRAVVSITSNIAEGFNRKTAKDKSHFYTIAHGSVAEVQNQLLIARDVKYLNNTEFSQMAEQTILVHKLLTGLIKSVLRS
jgi:four helix bundle protein